jgi:hypothetical protein
MHKASYLLTQINTSTNFKVHKIKYLLTPVNIKHKIKETQASYLLTQINTEHIKTAIAVFSRTFVGAVLPSNIQ